MAQISAFLTIPVIFILFLALPHDSDKPELYGLVMFSLGFVASWYSAGCNRPILAEIVQPAERSSIYAMLLSLEGLVGALGAPLVGILSEDVFGYQKTDLDVRELPPDFLENNRVALATSIVVVSVSLKHFRESERDPSSGLS